MMLKRLAIAITILLIIAMAAATVVERYSGVAIACRYIYGSVWFGLMWVALAVVGIAAVCAGRLYRRPATFMIHMAFVLILAGAGVTRLTAAYGSIHLSSESPCRELPFVVELRDFEVICYPGTDSPADYVAHLAISHPAGSATDLNLSINHPGSHGGYRFYLESYTADGDVTLKYSADTPGTCISYAGYLLLLGAMVAFFFDRRSRFRMLLRGATVAVMLSAAMSAECAPRSVSRVEARALADLYVNYNGRICPLSVMATEFTEKITGSDRYRDLNAIQVLAGWIIYTSEWVDEPMIKMKGTEPISARELYDLCRYNPDQNTRQDREARERLDIIDRVASTQALRIFPYTDGKEVVWASPVDRLPEAVDAHTQLFFAQALNYLSEKVVSGDEAGSVEVIQKLRRYQREHGRDSLPSDSRFRAEQIYLDLNRPMLPAMVCLLLGMVVYMAVVRAVIAHKEVSRILRISTTAIAAITLVYVCLLTALRWYVSGHVPLSNGFETMQSIALCSLAVAIVASRRFVWSLPFGMIVAGLAFMVSMMAGSNPSITPLMPVLSSPLLAVHVVLVMIAYSLLAFAMMGGVTGWILELSHRHALSARMARLDLLICYPAVFALAAGIFTGAVWANESWGRYWGWDPKETWALITMLIYAAALHTRSIAWLRSARHIHTFTVAAFAAVLITYFGVNFLLGGLHSYA